MTDTMQFFPALDPATEEALRYSIRRFGVLVPVIIDQDGQLLDGHHRRRIAAEERVACPTRQVIVPPDADPAEVALTLNNDRRHMDREQRRAVVAHLRSEGFSTRAIADAVGVGKSTVDRDLDGIVPAGTMPDTVRTSDGRTYPATRPEPKPAPVEEEPAAANDDEDPVEIIEGDRPVDDLYDGELTAIDSTLGPDATIDDRAKAINEAVRSRNIPTKPDLGGGISHPARYTDALIPVFRDILDRSHPTGGRILDPFAGTGKIHLLADDLHKTVGVEIEPEWAGMHPDTIVGDALALPFDDGVFDAIVTSPTYGNRLADHHNATDPETRRSYKHDLGRDLAETNSGAMHWGPEYREFHERAWTEAVRVLGPCGVFILNIKDHIRAGEWQDVTAWHVCALLDLGLCIAAIRPVPTPSMRAGANNTHRVGAEMVIGFDRGGAR